MKILKREIGFLIFLILIFNSLTLADSLDDLIEDLKSLNAKKEYYTASILAEDALASETFTQAHDSSKASLYNVLAMSYYYLVEDDKAERYWAEALSLSIDLYGKLHKKTGEILYPLSLLYKGQQEWNLAEDVLLTLLENDKHNYGEVHDNVISTMQALAEVYENQVRYDEALILLDKTIAMRKKLYGEVSRKYSDGYLILANFYNRIGELQKAKENYLIEAEIKEEVYGHYHEEIVNSLKDVVSICKKLIQFDETDSLYGVIIDIDKQLYGEESIEISLDYHKRGMNLYDLGRFKESEEYAKMAVNIQETLLPPNDTLLADSYNTLAIAFESNANFDLAEKYYFKSLEIYNYNEIDSTHSAMIYGNIGTLFRKQGKYSKAEEYLLKAINMKEELYSAESIEVALTLTPLGNLYDIIGKLDQALRIHKRSLDILEKKANPKDPLIAYALNNIALIYKQMGSLSDAKSYYLRSLSILQQAYKYDNSDIASVYNNLGSLELDLYNYDDAEKYFLKSFEIKESIFEPNHPAIGDGLYSLAALYLDTDEYDEAEKLYLRCRDIYLLNYGYDHVKFADVLNNLALVYSKQGKLEESKGYFKEALDIYEKTLGENHNALAVNLNSYCYVERKLKEYSSAFRLASEAYNIRKFNFVENSSVLSESDALQYSDLYIMSMYNALSCYFDIPAKDSLEKIQAANIILSGKGQVTDVFARRQKHLTKLKNPITEALLDSLQVIKIQLSRLFTSGKDDYFSSYDKVRDSLLEISKRLEETLGKYSDDLQISQSDDFSVEQVASNLPENSVLVDFLTYYDSPIEDNSYIPYYIALIVSDDMQVDIVKLDSAVVVEKYLDRYIKHFDRIISEQKMPKELEKRNFTKVCKPLYEKLWKPLEKYFADKDLILLSPDGFLNLLSFAGLLDDNGSYLIEKYPLHYVSSGRDVIKYNKPMEKTNKGLFALGDPDYNATIYERAPTKVNYDPRPNEDISDLNAISNCNEIESIYVDSLPGTRSEIKLIIKKWNENRREDAYQFFDVSATEENFKLHAIDKRVIHLATHGFYLSGDCSKSGLYTTSINKDVTPENSLLYSGLLVAGANLHGKGTSGYQIEDGIITAYEVSALDLSGTEMVVLSACETGKGDILEGEGVYGLRRAFLMAGSRSVVSALWSVPDKTTAEMISDLYIQNEMTLAQKMRASQINQINKLRESGEADHPFSWAAFMAIGDWKVLSSSQY